jgi:hypothetical protein
VVYSNKIKGRWIIMEIIDLGLQFRQDQLEGGNVPRYIGLHHSGGVNTVEAYHQQHLNQGWAGLGYDFVVDLDGKKYKGRDPRYVPAGILGHNQDSLHICAIGNFETMTMPQVQKESIKELIAYCKSTWPTITDIKGHCELMATDCPGKNYPLQEMKNAFYNYSSVSTPVAPISNGKVYPLPFKYNRNVLLFQRAANAMDIKGENGLPLVEDGVPGDNTLYAVMSIKAMLKRGMTNPLVGAMQFMFGIKVDNNYGDYPYHETYDMVGDFQESKKLEVDHIVGYHTWIELFKAWC